MKGDMLDGRTWIACAGLSDPKAEHGISRRYCSRDVTEATLRRGSGPVRGQLD